MIAQVQRLANKFAPTELAQWLEPRAAPQATREREVI